MPREQLRARVQSTYDEDRGQDITSKRVGSEKMHRLRFIAINKSGRVLQEVNQVIASKGMVPRHTSKEACADVMVDWAANQVDSNSKVDWHDVCRHAKETLVRSSMQEHCRRGFSADLMGGRVSRGDDSGEEKREVNWIGR